MKNLGREKKLQILEELLYKTYANRQTIKKSIKICCFVLVLLTVFSLITTSFKTVKMTDLDDDSISVISSPIASAGTKRNIISIPTGTVKANPFVPYRSLGEDANIPKFVNDVPKFDLVDPPEVLGAKEAAAKMMDTVVSGILYDKYSPSAILKIDGNDYLVKKGDEIQKYKVIAIAQDSVTVKYGNNTYKAGIGEILTEGALSHNEVSNLSKKFGGEKR